MIDGPDGAPKRKRDERAASATSQICFLQGGHNVVDECHPTPLAHTAYLALRSNVKALQHAKSTKIKQPYNLAQRG